MPWGLPSTEHKWLLGELLQCRLIHTKLRYLIPWCMVYGTLVMYGMDWLTVRQEAVLVKSSMWWKCGFQYPSINKWNVKEKFINILHCRDIAWLCLYIYIKLSFLFILMQEEVSRKLSLKSTDLLYLSSTE